MSRLSDVNAFIERSRECRTADDLRRLMEAITCEMGFSAYALFQHVRRFSWSDTDLLALSNYPREWLVYFFEHNFQEDDPVHIASYRTSVGFRFSEIPSLIDLTDRQREILAAARRHGIGDGFCVPAHIPSETAGTCTFVVRELRSLPEHNLPMAQLVGSFAYEAARRIHLALPEPPPDGTSQNERRSITGRQLECLVLVAKGKTDWEIATILDIGAETVKHHIRQVRERYDVGTRIQAAMRAISDGDLDIRDVVS
jgi:LuxR family quorum-sensing system transcriptional regulator CciR